MKFNSQSLAKILLLLSVVIASISGWYIWTASKDLPTLQSNQRATAKKKLELETARNDLMALPVSAKQMEVAHLEKAFSQFVLDVMNARTQYAVDVGQVLPSKPAQGEKTSVLTLADDLPGTTLKAVKLDITGTYTDYDRFLGFLEHVRTLGAVSVVQLKVKGNTYALTMRVYGKS